MKRTIGPRGRAVLACTAVVLAACGDLGFAAGVTGRRPFDPPATYQPWWSATETCSGRTGRFDRVTWYLADGITGDGKLAFARWSEPHEIVIVHGYEDDERIVRHEMLHDLLEGDRLHERTEWDVCGLRVNGG